MRAKSISAAQDGSGSAWKYTRRGYALSRCLYQFKRHPIATLGTLLVLGITLALPAILAFAYPNLESLGERSLQGESITAYLQTEISDAAGAQLADSLAQRADIARTEYVTKAQSLRMLGESNGIQSAVELLGENPLPGVIVVYPHVNRLSMNNNDQLTGFLTNSEAVERVQQDLTWVQRLSAVVSLIKWVGGLLAAFLTISALLVIANTIRLELARRRNEIEVAHLLGAPKHFINRPGLYTGALYGFLGGIVACILGLAALNAVRQPADTLTSLYKSEFALIMPSVSQIVLIIAICAVLGLIGAISSLYRSSQQLTHRY